MNAPRRGKRGGRGVWHEAMVLVCVPLAAPVGLSPLLILTLCGPDRVLVVSTEPPDDLSCLTTRGVRRGGGGFGWDPLPPRVPLWSPRKTGQQFLKLKSSWHRRDRSKILAVSLKLEGEEGGGL